MKRCSIVFILLFIIAGIHGVHAQFEPEEQRRFALVIGVKNYRHVSVLQNTLNDATDMATLLKARGFQVIELYDPSTKRAMQDAVISYFRLLRESKNSIDCFTIQAMVCRLTA